MTCPSKPDSAGRPIRRETARALARRDRERDAGPGCFEIGAVVGRAALDRQRSHRLLVEGVGPVLPTAGGMPRRATVDRHLDRADQASAIVGRRPRHGVGPDLATDPLAGLVMVETGAWCRSTSSRARARAAASKAGVHVGEEVHRRLLHPHVGRHARSVVVVVETPRPLHGSGSEHECTARCAVQASARASRCRCRTSNRCRGGDRW